MQAPWQAARQLEQDGDAGGAVVGADEAGDVLGVVVGADDDGARSLARDAADDVAVGMLHPNLGHARLTQPPSDQPYLLAAPRRAGRTGADPHLGAQVVKGALGVEAVRRGRTRPAARPVAAARERCTEHGQ